MRVVLFSILFSFFVWAIPSGQVGLAVAGEGHSHKKEEKHQKEKSGGHGHDEKEDHAKEKGSEHGDEHGDEDGDEHEEGLSLNKEVRSIIELKTEQARRRKLGGYIQVYGKIAQDTENYSYLIFEGEGIVESIKVGLGEVVNKGDVLLTIRKDDGEIEQMKSEIHGIVLSSFVKQGDRVDSFMSLLSIINMDVLRATIDIYERDFQLVKVGQKVVLKTAAFPNKNFYGKVVYLSPLVDEHTQAIRIRVDVQNLDHLLRLGMFVSGKLIYALDEKVLTLPLTALQELNGEDIVFVAGDGDNLEVREVVLGQIVDDYIEIVEGLEEGETVVTQGSFYLKSEKAKSSFGGGHGH